MGELSKNSNANNNDKAQFPSCVISRPNQAIPRMSGQPFTRQRADNASHDMRWQVPHL